jgi:hypothetical protein
MGARVRNPGWLGLTAEILYPTNSLPDAACARSLAHIKTFDIDLDNPDPQRVAAAKAICSRCPVLSPCAQWAADAAPGTVAGVVGGTWREWQPRGLSAVQDWCPVGHDLRDQSASRPLRSGHRVCKSCESMRVADAKR